MHVSTATPPPPTPSLLAGSAASSSGFCRYQRFMRFCLKNLWQYLPTAAATPPSIPPLPLPMHGKLSLPAAAILLCLQAIFCAWCCQIDATKAPICMRSIFIDARTRAEAAPHIHLHLGEETPLLSFALPLYRPLPATALLHFHCYTRSSAQRSLLQQLPPPLLFLFPFLPLCCLCALLCLFNLPKNVHCARFTCCKKRAGGY